MRRVECFEFCCIIKLLQANTSFFLADILGPTLRVARRVLRPVWLGLFALDHPPLDSIVALEASSEKALPLFALRSRENLHIFCLHATPSLATFNSSENLDDFDFFDLNKDKVLRTLPTVVFHLT